MEQMSIFDYIKPDSLDQLSDEELAKSVGIGTGIKFEYNSFMQLYRAKVNGITVDIHLSQYADSLGGKRFISLNMWIRKEKRGLSIGFDSIEEVVDFIKKYVSRMDGEEE